MSRLLNDQVYVLDGLEDELRGKESSTGRGSRGTTFPLVREVPELGFRIMAVGRAPFPVPDAVSTAYAYFVGPAVVAATTADDEVAGFGGLATLTIAGDRVLGVLMPDQTAISMLGGGKLDLNQAPLGFAAGRADVTVSTDGVQGVFKKRPRRISLECPNWDCHLGIDVSKLHVRESVVPRLQSGQEIALVEALR